MTTPFFDKEVEDIYRLKIPFDTVYTSVFLVVDEGKAVLLDCATTKEDVENYILPALATLGYRPTDLTAIVLTHRHGDHAGGLPHLLRYAPHLEVVTSVRRLTKNLRTYSLAGHTEDAIGLFDERTHTLLSGDGLQGAGVDKYRCSLANPTAYRETLERIRKDDQIENILFSHAYEPWLADAVWGRGAVCACLSDCEKYIGEKK